MFTINTSNAGEIMPTIVDATMRGPVQVRIDSYGIFVCERDHEFTKQFKTPHVYFYRDKETGVGHEYVRPNTKARFATNAASTFVSAFHNDAIVVL